MYPPCKTKSHSPYYKCPLLKILFLKMGTKSKGNHLDDLYLSHHKVNKTDHDVSSVLRDLQVSPVSTYTATYPPITLYSQDDQFDQRPYH